MSRAAEEVIARFAKQPCASRLMANVSHDSSVGFLHFAARLCSAGRPVGQSSEPTRGDRYPRKPFDRWTYFLAPAPCWPAPMWRSSLSHDWIRRGSGEVDLTWRPTVADDFPDRGSSSVRGTRHAQNPHPRAALKCSDLRIPPPPDLRRILHATRHLELHLSQALPRHQHSEATSSEQVALLPDQ